MKKTNPVAKEVRTPQFKSKVIDSKKIYNRKNFLQEQEELKESYEQSKRNREEREEREEK